MNTQSNLSAFDRACAMARATATPEQTGRAYIYASAYSVREYGHNDYVHRNVAAYYVSTDPTVPLPLVRTVTASRRAIFA